MSEIGEGFAGWREASKLRRAANRDASAKRLIEAGIPFKSRNGGAHLIVDDLFHFWPGTGLWRGASADSRERGRGVFSLIKRHALVKAQP